MIFSRRNLRRSPLTSPQRILAFSLGALLFCAALAGAQTWTPLVHQPTFGASTALLLTDGTVMVHSNGGSTWWRLTPDVTGSYVNGTWSQLASLPSGYAPLYYASAVLPDGRVIVEGGEYNNFSAVWTSQGAIYNPASNTWTSVAPPSGWSSIGDAQSAVLPNGTFMLANALTFESALLNASTLTWTPTGSGKADNNNEEGWTLLPNGKVLTIDTHNGTSTEVYNPATGSWSFAGNTVVQIVMDSEIGPAVLRPNGTVFATGGTSNTAIYNSAFGTWSAGPTFPNGLDLFDGPAALLPNGNVLTQASPGEFAAPSQFFEFNGSSLIAAPAPPRASVNPSYVGRMLILPTGQILLTDGSTDVEIYTPGGTYQSSWQPTINSFPSSVTPGTANYSITGWQFNGLSQGSMYGDDAQSATNYPLVRITNNATGHVFYAKTHNHSTMAVATGNTVVSTQFDVPANVEAGASQLEVVANGIPSPPVSIQVAAALHLDHASFTFPNGSAHSFYLDANLHVIDLSLSSAGAWQKQDLTALTSSGLAEPNSALTALVDNIGNGRVFYIGTNHHVLQLKLDTTNTWTQGDVMTQAGTSNTAAPGSALTSFGAAGSNAVHVLYIDASQHVNDLARTSAGSTGTWSNLDLTALTSAGLAVSGSALTGMVDNIGNGRVFYIGTNQHVLQLKLDTTNTWTQGDVMTQAGTSKTAVAGSALISFGAAGSNAVHVLYLDSSQHVNDLARTSAGSTGTWSNQDLTTLTSAGLAVPGSALAGLVDSIGNGRVFYVGTNQHVLQLKLDPTNTWTQGDVMTQAGTSKIAAPGSGLTSFGDSGGSAVHVLYLDSIQHVNDLVRTSAGSTGTWSDTDVTALTGP
jgi:hypothetical protein